METLGWFCMSFDSRELNTRLLPFNLVAWSSSDLERWYLTFNTIVTLGWHSTSVRFINASKATLWFWWFIAGNWICYKFNTFLTIFPNILSLLILHFAVTYWTWRLYVHSLQTAHLLALHPGSLVSAPSCNPENHSVPVHASPWRQR